MDEFARIATYFAPLAGEQGAFGLRDDAALLTPPLGKSLVITQDTLVETIHFLGSEKPEWIAKKALRVNLSDLAAKGAQPYAYFLSLSLPKHCDECWLAAFAQGLAEDQVEFGLSLMGGDSTSAPMHITITITALGCVQGHMVQRRGAQIGDALYVTGTIGDAWLGLQIAQKKMLQKAPQADALLQRYYVPQPRSALAPLIHAHATACLDVSDGLLQDAQHLCHNSALGAKIDLSVIPVSIAALAFAPDHLALATGGDDYELLFTAPEEALVYFAASGVPVTRIGEMTAGEGLQLFDQGKPINLPQKLGWQHTS